MNFYKACKKSFNRKYARAFSTFLNIPGLSSHSSRARFEYYANSHLSRYGKWSRSL